MHLLHPQHQMIIHQQRARSLQAEAAARRTVRAIAANTTNVGAEVPTFTVRRVGRPAWFAA